MTTCTVEIGPLLVCLKGRHKHSLHVRALLRKGEGSKYHARQQPSSRPGAISLGPQKDMGITVSRCSGWTPLEQWFRSNRGRQQIGLEKNTTAEESPEQRNSAEMSPGVVGKLLQLQQSERNTRANRQIKAKEGAGSWWNVPIE